MKLLRMRQSTMDQELHLCHFLPWAFALCLLPFALFERFVKACPPTIE